MVGGMAAFRRIEATEGSRPEGACASDAGAFGRLTRGKARRIAQCARLLCFEAAPGGKVRVNGPVAQLDRATDF